MAIAVGLAIGSETWKMQERSIRSIKENNPSQEIVIYYSANSTENWMANAIADLGAEPIDIGKPGLIAELATHDYSEYNSRDFNIKTSFKWLALLGAMSNKLDDVIFIDADIKILKPLPQQLFAEIRKSYDIIVQDEGNCIYPKHPCTGFIGFKFCAENITLLESLHKEQCASIVSGTSKHDQAVFYEHLSQHIDLYQKTYFLPQMLFPVGYLAPIYTSFKGKSDGLNMPTSPIIFHSNWTTGIKNKCDLMDAFCSRIAQGSTGESEAQMYRVGQFSIALTKDHLLPQYQSNHPEYDRFLPHLAKSLPPESTVIDIGANCGDTLAAMASSNPKLRYTCIEADNLFFSLLKKKH